MPYLLNLSYLLILMVFSPWLLYRVATTGKYRRGLWRKFTGMTPLRHSTAPCVWFHGVSVGEIHLLRQVALAFRQRHPDWECVISTTTDTGYDEACKRFPDLTVFFWPLDFTWAARRAIRRVRPDLIVLAEGELWPNFLSAAQRARVPVAVINGRMSPRSFRRYRCLSFLTRRLFAKLDLCAVQTEEYADHFRALGARPQAVHVTGSVKYDGACTERDNPRTQELRRLLQVTEHDLVWIAGSTQAPEEEIVVDIYRKMRAQHPNLRLFVVPRQKERFEEVASLLQRSGLPILRRSQLTAPVTDPSAIVLVDTIGELGALWGLADVAFVGGSLDGKRGGQNMIEPAAYGAAVIFGPHVWNFQETVDRLLRAGAALQVGDAAELHSALRELCDQPERRCIFGMAARQLVLQQQGATERTIELLDTLLALGHFVERESHRLAG